MNFSTLRYLEIPEGKIESIFSGNLLLWKKKEAALKKLNPPIIEIANQGILFLKVLKFDENSKEYILYVDGDPLTSFEGEIFNLSSLDLSVGEHQIWLVAIANGYQNSNDSNTEYINIQSWDMSIDSIKISGNSFEEDVITYYEPSRADYDEYNNELTLIYESLQFKMVVGNLNIEGLPEEDKIYAVAHILKNLKKGQVVTLYPFDPNLDFIEGLPTTLIFTVHILEGDALIRYNQGDYDTGNTLNTFQHLNPTDIIIECDNTEGKITIIDESERESSTNDTVNLWEGIHIEVQEPQ